jgi:hypothetical protein
MLRLETMVFDALYPHWLKRPVADMQRNLGCLNASTSEAVHDRWSEMQSGGGRSNRPALTGEYRLIPISIVCAIVAFDVRRERNVSDRVDEVSDGPSVLGAEPDRPATVEVTFEHFAVEDAGALTFEDHMRAWRELLPGMHQRLPCLARASVVAR